MQEVCNLLLTVIGGSGGVDFYAFAGRIPDSCASGSLGYETQGYVCSAADGTRSGGQLLDQIVNRCPAAADF
ncbi:hypothetical protein D3C87_2016930 [compost metagenome]